MEPSAILGTVLVGLPTSIAAVLFGLWVKALQSRLKYVQEQVKCLKKEISYIRESRAEEKGKHEGERDLVWREINTDKHKIAALQMKVDKAWDVLSRIGEPTFPKGR